MHLISWHFSVLVNNASAGLDGITFKNKLVDSCIDKFVSLYIFFSCSGEETRFLFPFFFKKKKTCGDARIVDSNIKILSRHSSE